MNLTDIIPQIVAAIRENVPDIEIDADRDSLRPLGELGIDSLDKMSILLSIQEAYDTEFDKEEIAAMDSIHDIFSKLTSLSAHPRSHSKNESSPNSLLQSCLGSAPNQCAC